jgi:hypothetical protein
MPPGQGQSEPKRHLKTYSRQHRQKIEEPVEPAEPRPKKRKIEEYFLPKPVQHDSHNFIPKDIFLSSSPKIESSIFSDHVQRSTPPSSPPNDAPPVDSLGLQHDHSSNRNGSSLLHSPLTTTSHNIQRSQPKRPAKKQMMIDLGECKSQKRCKDCGMEYIPTNPKDVAVHKKFHQSNLKGMDVDKTFLEKAKPNCIWKNGQGAFIIVVGRIDNAYIRKRVMKVLDLVNMELGALTMTEEQIWSQIDIRDKAQSQSMEKPASESKMTEECIMKTRSDRYRVYLYIEKQKCIGLCLAETITKAYSVLASDEAGKPQAKASSVDNSSIRISEDAAAAMMGISRIWTSTSHRNAGIARSLLDCARRNFLYGLAVGKDQIAFSQPTDSGAKLARKWFKKDYGWLVYVD